MTTPTAVGIDVGGTKAAAVRVVADATIQAHALADTPANDVPALLDAMRRAVKEVLDPSTTAIGLPTVVDNDCTMAAVGELLAGAGRGVSDFVYVGMGTGIGGGLVVDGAVRHGAHGFAGEIGHIIVEPGGITCGCGNQGCLETVASGQAITRLGRERLGVDGYGVVTAAKAGDEAARGILEEVGRRLGQGIGGLVNVFDPVLVIVGGGPPTSAGDLLLDPARRASHDTIMAADSRPEVPIVPAALGADAAAVGAALSALGDTS
jgi:glucokinase